MANDTTLTQALDAFVRSDVAVQAILADLLALVGEPEVTPDSTTDIEELS